MGKNVDQLPAVTAWENDDLLYLRKASDPIATADKGISAGNLFNSRRTYGQLFMDINTTPGAITTSTTPAVVTVFDNASPLQGITDTLVTGRLTVDAGQPTGLYAASFACSFATTTNTNYMVAMFINGAITGLAAATDQVNNAVNAGNAAASGLVSLSAGDFIDLRIWSDAAGSATFASAILNLTRI